MKMIYQSKEMVCSENVLSLNKVNNENDLSIKGDGVVFPIIMKTLYH